MLGSNGEPGLVLGLMLVLMLVLMLDLLLDLILDQGLALEPDRLRWKHFASIKIVNQTLQQGRESSPSK